MILSNDLTKGPLFPKMMKFAVPYLGACFLQTFYGMADLFITGQYNGAAPVTGVAIGSQVMHMMIVIIAGLTLGCAVSIAGSLGARDEKKAFHFMGSASALFIPFSFVMAAILFALMPFILSALQTPTEAWDDTKAYLSICFAGIPFIVLYNMVSGFFRGMGNTRIPMVIVALAGVVNIGLDFLLIGSFHMGAAGAAWGTFASEGVSVLLILLCLWRKLSPLSLSAADFSPHRPEISQILTIGVPISCQDGLIQISFLVITAIADARGVETAAAVGIVEKIISFLFLVPSAMMSTVSATTAQNMGAGKPERGKKVLFYGISVCVAFGLLCIAVVTFKAEEIVSLFVPGEEGVIARGADYFHSYVIDCAIAGIHFCFSGYFTACRKSYFSFLHNVISIFTVRIPGTYAAALLFPDTLFPMGLAAPMGSLLSVLICVYLYHRYFGEKKELRVEI
jgi:putative MATE family efflux protein